MAGSVVGRGRGSISGGRSSDGEESGPPGHHNALSHRPHRCSILNCGKVNNFIFIIGSIYIRSVFLFLSLEF